MGRARSWWNGAVRTVTWSPWFGRRVISVTIEVMPGAGTPESQHGRLVHCAMTPESARSLARRLTEMARQADGSDPAKVAKAMQVLEDQQMQQLERFQASEGGS